MKKLGPFFRVAQELFVLRQLIGRFLHARFGSAIFLGKEYVVDLGAGSQRYHR